MYSLKYPIGCCHPGIIPEHKPQEMEQVSSTVWVGWRFTVLKSSWSSGDSFQSPVQGFPWMVSSIQRDGVTLFPSFSSWFSDFVPWDTEHTDLCSTHALPRWVNTKGSRERREPRRGWFNAWEMVLRFWRCKSRRGSFGLSGSQAGPRIQSQWMLRTRWPVHLCWEGRHVVRYSWSQAPAAEPTCWGL